MKKLLLSAVLLVSCTTNHYKNDKIDIGNKNCKMIYSADSYYIVECKGKVNSIYIKNTDTFKTNKSTIN